MSLIKLPAGVPVNLYTAPSPAITVGRELLVESFADDAVRLFVTAGTPTVSDTYALLHPGQRLVSGYGHAGLWALSLDETFIGVRDAEARGWHGPEAVIPAAATQGMRAVNVQSYDESNRKLGSQWGASRRLIGAALNQKFYSIIKTRTLPVDLKARVFSYNGAGIVARFYTGFTPQVLPAPEPVYCLRPARAAFRDFDLYALAAAPVSLGSRWSYDLILEGAAQVQGKGAINAQAGQGWVIDPNTEVLLEIESLDVQNIGATLAMYNGLLDLPLP